MADRLSEYRRRRSAARTPEPSGGGEPATHGAARFVVQEHHATRLHWDLRLEHDGVAVSWAIPNAIPEDPKENRLAVHTEDHPLSYLEFEGEIPAGQYGAGTMRIWDRGTYELHEFTDRKVEVTLHGERLHGRYGLFPTGRGERDWMIHRMDPPSDPQRQPMPARLKPMLAKPAPLPDDAQRWAYEVKWDGVRALAYSLPGRLRLESRNGNDVTVAYPELQRLNRALSTHQAILDGEIVAFDADGRPSFARLQSRMHVSSASAARRKAKEVGVVYLAFDLLWLDGHAVTGLSYDERRELLEALDLGEGPAWRVPDVLDGSAEQVLEATRAAGLEGVVAKRRDAAYEPGRRSACWIKARNMQRIDVVIGGWTPMKDPPARGSERIGALLVGVEDGDGGLRWAGGVGSGLSDAELRVLADILEARDDSPFTGTQPPRNRRPRFVEPTRVAEVQFSEWTPDGLLRQPSYLGLREETPRSAFLDAGHAVKGGTTVSVGGRTLKVSNLDKVLYPATGFTKRDVIEYLVGVAPVILTHLGDRPITRKRYPDGVEGQAFFEKQCPSHRPDWVPTAAIEVKQKTIDFCLAADVPTLVWLANLAALELHVSLSRAGSPQTPTAVVFDLDPGAPATVVECCRVAALLEGMLAGLGLRCHAKTSGSKGLQVYLPLNHPEATYGETKGFARTVAELLAAGEPELVVAQMRKELRTGRVYVDWAQNEAYKTTVGAYSLRARERPTVSTPVTWEEVRACRDDGDPDRLRFEAADVLARVAEHGDLFGDVESTVQRLPALG